MNIFNPSRPLSDALLAQILLRELARWQRGIVSPANSTDAFGEGYQAAVRDLSLAVGAAIADTIRRRDAEESQEWVRAVKDSLPT